ncbi:unnamed protein product [Malus baccata var. baccata]
MWPVVSMKVKLNYEAFMWSRHLMLVEQEADPCDAGVSPSQDTDSINELNQLSHKRKRQSLQFNKYKSTIVYSSSSSQRVLIIGSYCECFSAGVYCLDSYACQNCYNKPEFEHTVFEIRHHIESRNPLAFTSKVVDNAIDSSANSTVIHVILWNYEHENCPQEDQNLTTTSSARHKRGSNCKKSKCLEKYCERYQVYMYIFTFHFSVSPASETWLKLAVLEDVDARIAKIPLALWQVGTPPYCEAGCEHQSNSPTFEVLSDISKSYTIDKSYLTRNSGKIPQAQLPSSKHPSDTGRLHWGCNVPCVLSSAGAHHDMMDDDTPEILGETSYPSKVVMVSSPNKKRLRSGRKFILHAVPFFPPLTPYHTSKEGTSEIGNDDGATNKNNWYEARFGCFSELIMDNLLTAYSIVQNNWTKLLIGFQLPQIHPKTTSVLPEVR